MPEISDASGAYFSPQSCVACFTLCAQLYRSLLRLLHQHSMPIDQRANTSNTAPATTATASTITVISTLRPVRFAFAFNPASTSRSR